MKIGSFNIKNDYLNMFNKNKDYKSLSVADLISSINFDLLGMQELTFKYNNEIMSRLDGYKSYGQARYGNFLAGLSFNETNNIITNKNVLFCKTVWLPWIPNNYKDLKKSILKFSIMPRIATIIIINDEVDGPICMINTHLDYQIPSIQIRQLEYLKKIILECNKRYPVIVTGDFNMQFSDEKFLNFVRKLEEHKIIRVNINDSTWHKNDSEFKTLDHIFIPNYWDIKDAKVASSKGISDHDLIYVNALVRKKGFR